MVRTNIQFNENVVAVQLIGADPMQIPSLLSALRGSKFTLHHLQPSLERIDLFRAEAILYSENGNKARIPVF